MLEASDVGNDVGLNTDGDRVVGASVTTAVTTGVG